MTSPYSEVSEAERLYQREPIAGQVGVLTDSFGAERPHCLEPQGVLHDLSVSSPLLSWARVDPDETQLHAAPPALPPRCAVSERPVDVARVPVDSELPKDFAEAQRIYERCQSELLLQSRRQDEVFSSIAKVEADLSRVARLAAENEGLRATERQQKHAMLAGLTRRTEEALMTCEALRESQEYLVRKVERLEGLAEDGERAAEEACKLQEEVDALQAAVREKLDVYGHALRRLDAVEQVQEENARLRQEVAQLRRASERRDLEMAAVQGQLDALTKLVKEQLREPHSTQPGSGWTSSPG